MTLYLTNGTLYKGTLIQRLVTQGCSPVRTAFNYVKPKHCRITGDGVVDSLKYLIFNENVIKPWSDELLLTRLLTRSL